MLLAFEAKVWLMCVALLHIFWVVTTSNTQKCIRERSKNTLWLWIFCFLPKWDIQNGSKTATLFWHCFIPSLGKKMRSYKGNTTTNNPLSVGRGKERGVWFLTKLQFYAPYDGAHIVWFYRNTPVWVELLRVPQDYVWEPEAVRSKPYRVTKVCPMIRNHKTRPKISNKNYIEDFTSSCFMAKGEPSCFNFLTISSILFPEKRLEEKTSVNKLPQSPSYLSKVSNTDIRNRA